VVASAGKQYRGQTRNFIAGWDATTGLADTFNQNLNSLCSQFSLQADGMILVVDFQRSHNHIARFFPVGWRLFRPNANGIVHSIALQPTARS